MATTFTPTEHPVLRIPTPAQMTAMGYQRWMDHMLRREEIIAQEKEDPLRYGWEPSSWRICDALLDWSWLPDKDAAARTREALGFKEPVNTLLILGGNRGGKSEYAAKRCQMTLNAVDESIVWPFHSSGQNSRDWQQPLFWKYMPLELKKTLRSQTAYISYNMKYGFSDDKFVLPNRSVCTFRNYEQDISKIEGGEIDVAWPDELVPPLWVETLEFRVATRNGKIVITFTPVMGYTGTVKMFLDGAKVMKTSTAFLCPKDKGEPEEELAIALENCDKWIDGEPSQPPIPEGRKFAEVPRVLKCARESSAVVFFHSSDNPYGNPRSVVEKVRGRSVIHIKERYYGIANKTISARFPKFDLKVHGFTIEQLPDKGTNWMLLDPAGGRNYFMEWFRMTEKHAYLWKEWPGGYEIPMYGYLGPWALTDGKKLDGRIGPAQQTLGFGHLQYKKEIARLEGWEDYKKAQRDGESSLKPQDWDPRNGAEVVIYDRYMDSRAASNPKLDNDRPTTLITEFEELGLYFKPTPGDEVNEGVAMVNDWLDYLATDEGAVIDEPFLKVCEDCENVIFALQTWTGQDGRKGACKDPIDLLRYASLADICYFPGETGTSHRGTGGHY